MLLNNHLVVIWEDPYGLAVAKPAGLLTQGRPEGEETLEDRVRSHLCPADPNSIYLGTVHRLDRPVSGIVLWAKTPKSARRWSEQFASRSTWKEYWALVEVQGAASSLEASGTWEDRLSSPDAEGRARVGPEGEGSKTTQAVTRYEVGRDRAIADGLIWLKLRPETGRTHQLRVQAAARGMPIVGDTSYGASRSFPAGIALHARSLTLEHPITRRPILAEARLPPSWDGWLG